MHSFCLVTSPRKQSQFAMTVVSQMDRSPWQVSPTAAHHKRFTWPGGTFETALRDRTSSVEGTIRSSSHLVMATLSGGAKRHEFVTDDGYRFRGGDRTGFVSFLPAGCERRLKLNDVAWEWASIALPSDADTQLPIGPFSTEKDDFLFGLLSHFRYLLDADGGLDVTYCDTMALALRQYLGRRCVPCTQGPPASAGGLPPRQLRKVAEYVEANLDAQIRIADLARLVDLSEGHFHRSFRSTTGKTPLQFINERRVERAAEILSRRPGAVVDVAMEVGFVSASHFARIFRRLRGMTPERYRRDR